MAVFDLRAFTTLLGQGQGVLGSVGGAFGVPSCLLNLASEVLKLLPTPALFGIMGELEDGRAMADSVSKSIMSQVRNVLGIIEWDSEEGGLRFVSQSSKMGYESNQGSVIGALGALITGVATLGGNLYANYKMAENQIRQIKDCINSYRNYLKFKNGAAAEELAKLDPVAYDDYIGDQYMMEMAALRQVIDFQNKVTDAITQIQDIINERIEDPTLEPLFVCDALPFVSGLGLPVECGPKEDPKSVFRLVYGPPRSTAGQFLLSKDGIYFDSQSSGITPALVYLQEKEERVNEFRNNKWKLNYDPNLGGRGDAFSTEDLNAYVNTTLDPNFISESEQLRIYYAKDGLLQELIGNKNKRIYDLSAQIDELEQESAPESIIYNYKQSLISENSLHQQKINKRKKQIELAVVLPTLYNLESVYKPGEVPVNDFSYLAGINIALDIERQKALSFSQVDIDGVVSPIQLSSTYVVSKGNSTNGSVEHLIISELSDGAIIYDGSSVSSVNSVILPAESFITTDSIISMYNFLETNIEDPSSTSFTLRNATSKTDENYAQLVGNSQDQIFRRGLGIPYLEGITKHSSTTPQEISGLGSYVKLPNIKQLNDLLYSKDGATIDFWVHMPNLLCASNGYNEGGVSSLFRLVLANENTGYQGTSPTTTEAGQNNFGSEVVRGFMLGFTRDVRITSDQAATNSPTSNHVSASCFFIAPTQSTSVSSVSFINRSSYDGQQCNSQARYHGMTQKLTQQTNGLYLSSCENEFCHISVTFDRQSDLVRFYFDGIPVTTSSMSYVFGIQPHSMPNLPTFKKLNSFDYVPSALNATAPAKLKYGPRMNKYFTPWIVGGGYTDGMYQYGNFMGSTYGGVKSGLRGYLGSMKFYAKSLSESEIYENYRAQKDFFKNIDTTTLSIGTCLD